MNGAAGVRTMMDRDNPLPGARMALALLIAINLFNYIDRQVLAAVVPELKKEYFPEVVAPDGTVTSSEDKLVNSKLGTLQLAFMVTYMLIAPLFGWLADRFPRWKLIAVGVALWTLASGASGLAMTFNLMLLTRCFVGLGEAAYGPAAPTIISDLYPVKIRGKVIAWFYVAIPVGSALGYVLGGMMVDLTHDWRWAFFVVVPPGIALAILSLFMPEPSRGSADAAGKAKQTPKSEPAQGLADAGPQSGKKVTLKDFLVLFRTPSYVLDTLGMTAMTFALGGIGYWMPTYIIEDRGQTSSVNTIFGGIVVVAGLIATLLGGMAGDKLRDRIKGSYFVVSAAAMFLGFLILPLVLYTPFPWAWVFIFLTCFCLFFNTGPTNTVLANVTHPSIRASAFALNILIIHLFGDAVSPAIMGYVADKYSMHTALLGVSLLILVGGVLWLCGARYLDRDTEMVPMRLG